MTDIEVLLDYLKTHSNGIDDLVYKSFKLIDWSGSNLVGLNLSLKNDFDFMFNIDLSYSNIIQSDLTNHNLSFGKLDHATINNTNFQNVVLPKDLMYVRMSDVDLTKAHIFDELNFSNALLERVVFKNRKDCFVYDSYDDSCKFVPPFLQNYNFTNAVLKDIDFSECDLRFSNFTNVDFRMVNLFKADLSNSILIGSNLSKLNLTTVKLYDADLSYAKLLEVNLRGAQFQEYNNLDKGPNFFHADLSNSDLRYCFLQHGNFENSILQRTDFSNALLFNANLSGADLSGAVLIGANLENANLKGANLENAILTDACLSGANLSQTNLSRAILRGTILD